MPRYKAPRIIGGIFKMLFFLVIAAICGILFWRVCFSTIPPSGLKHLAPNPTLHAAYAQKGDDLILRHQDQASITRAEQNSGYFSVVSSVFIPEAEQVQILFRYNNSTIRHLAEDHSLPQLPAKSEHLFDVTLVQTTDLTPQDPTDNLKEETLAKQRIHPTSYERDETLLYTYYRYTFDGVKVEELTDGVYVDVYYVGALDYEARPYGTLCIYSTDQKWLPYSPTGADRRAMKEEP